MSPEDCAKLFPDDPRAGDNTVVLRHIPPWHFYRDAATGLMRLSSAAFEDDRDGDPMSVYRREVIDGESGDVNRVMLGHQGFALASLTTGQFRSKLQTVHPDPLPEESSHAKVCGPKPGSVRRWFATQSV